ncbi:hypothetical protein IE53DRAFT_122629 [Violaceomyces palustris]|uniref:Uncharacterized protein n=1 Tax=Violaceomyces palustris TaxID=1673888 RepID=A0ACD0NVQ6_9BASI|nr:hypothetical protein IE53DRAFT_122629 [Violaceomyces palustris]
MSIPTNILARKATSVSDDTDSILSQHTLKTLQDPYENYDDEDRLGGNEGHDPWMEESLSPRIGSQDRISFPSSEPMIMSPEQRRKTLIRSALQLLALFLVCSVGLGGTLWLALPVIDDSDRPFLRIPRSFDQLQDLNRVLQHYKDENFGRVMLSWFIVYMFLQAFSIPGSMYMSILAGAMWGVPLALPLVCASVATGATICYLISKFLGAVLVALPSWKARVDSWKEKLDQHSDNMLSYLIVIRMMPLPPHNVVNILAPHLGIDIPLFWISTFFGIFAVSVIHTTIGEKLDQMTSADDFNLFSLRNVLLLSGVCLAVLIPVGVRRFSKAEPLEEVEEGEDGATTGPLHLPGGEDERVLIGRGNQDLYEQDEDDNDDDDELPPISGVRVHGGNVDVQEDLNAWRDQRGRNSVGGERGGTEDEYDPSWNDDGLTFADRSEQRNLSKASRRPEDKNKGRLSRFIGLVYQPTNERNARSKSWWSTK